MLGYASVLISDVVPVKSFPCLMKIYGYIVNQNFVSAVLEITLVDTYSEIPYFYVGFPG